MRKKIAGLVVAVCVLGAASLAWGNDSSFGGSGSSLVPLRETRVKMAWEEITLEKRHDPRVKGEAWYVSARYEFHNPSQEAVRLQIGYPETHCHPDSDCNGDGGRFRRLKTKVRGVQVKPREGKVDVGVKWAPEMGRVYLFDVTFQPGERVQIEHSYTYDASYSVEGEWVDYLTRTGAFWAGPIGRARFTVRMPHKPLGVVVPPEYTLRSYTEKLVGKKAQTELVFEMQRWTPTRDFAVYFPSDLNLNQGSCPRVQEIAAAWEAAGRKDEVVIRDHLQSLDKEELRICRNWPYARHGYSFKSKDLQQHFYQAPSTFYGYPWYPGQAEDAERTPENLWSYLPLRVNPDFSPALLTSREQLYIKLAKAAEAAPGKK